MKNIITTLLFFMAFSLSANAQEAKKEAKKEVKKDACCASKKTASAEEKAKCHTEMASTSATPSTAAKCDAKATMTADAKNEAVLPKTEAVTDKKACSSKGSCCASKAEAKKV